MGDIMRPIPAEQLLRQVMTEYRREKSIFGVRQVVSLAGSEPLQIFGGKLEMPFGPAAGPHTQLAQNIIASYAAGARFFELKTVQKMDGRELAACVPKPCINAADECYNCEWSTELTVQEAYEEYVKAWFVCRILAKELSCGDPDAFVFNMSVGYDLDGIKTPKIDGFIEGMKDAAGSDIFRECREAALSLAGEGLFEVVDAAYIEGIPSKISNSITESTLHGCPPDEIERIASYLLTEKGLNTFIKCNPTLLGYEFARKTMDVLGFDYMVFDDHHFREDLQWADAVPMLQRLQKLADEKGLSFGVKLTNTFPVEVKAGELPSEEMYMSGRSLYPLTMELCRRISAEFGGQLRISYSGGADARNIGELLAAGIWPVTMATTLLKPGGYQRFAQMAELVSKGMPADFAGVDAERAASLAAAVSAGSLYTKPVKALPARKRPEALPLLDCFDAPCRTNCPIHQDIPAYLKAVEEGRHAEAFRIITERNPLPFTTGTICPHTCADRCMRVHYEEGLHIREMKLLAARKGYELPVGTAGADDGQMVTEAKQNRAPSEVSAEKAAARAEPAVESVGEQEETVARRKVAVVGAGPAGLSAAYFLSRAGIDVTVFEKREKAGGVPLNVIPSFRIDEEEIAKDVALCRSYGAKFVFGREIRSAEELKAEGFTDYIIAVGAWAKGANPLSEGEALDALEFLAKLKADPDAFGDAKEIAVIGGGNTAMDVARAALRLKSAEKVRLIYRRTRRFMPADEEELEAALHDGVEFCELYAPERFADGKLLCSVMTLGDPDESGRRSPVKTGESAEFPADLVIAAVGERIDGSLFESFGAALDAKGRPKTDESGRTDVPQLYAAGDAKGGPATAVRAIADASRSAAAICAEAFGITAEEAEEKLFGRYAALNDTGDASDALEKRGILKADLSEEPDTRCLRCAAVCETCIDVCPNRANTAIVVPGMAKPQILHIDGRCNECGNCAVFCPYSGRPYKDKLTLFASFEDFADSENPGFLPTEDPHITRVRFGGETKDYDIYDPGCGLFDGVRRMILAVCESYAEIL